MMFWRSVVVKLWVTFLFVIFVVLAIISLLLVEFFDGYHVNQAEEQLLDEATKIAELIEIDQPQDTTERIVQTVKDDTSKITILSQDDLIWTSDSSDSDLPTISKEWLKTNPTTREVIENHSDMSGEVSLDKGRQVLIVGTYVQESGVSIFAYQSSEVVAETTKQTEKIILLAAAIAIILMTVFAFFLSSRITAPLIKMRKGALELARGEFKTKVPIVTHDEIGELAMAFNRMGRQLNYHMDALRQEKEQLYSILRSMADGVITFNREAGIIVSNPPAQRFLYDWRYELGNQQNDFLPEAIIKLLHTVIQSESEQVQEVKVQGRYWVMIMSPLYDETNVRGVVAVIRDMTQERKTDQLREEFIANVSHELRTPISMLQGYSEAIVDDIAASPEEKNELASIIRDESLRMGRLVNELLDLARMKAGHEVLHKKEVNLALFIDRIIRKFQVPANEQMIHIYTENKVELATIFVDQDRLEQVLTNLIDNAMQHTEKNGEVKLIVEEEVKNVRFSIKDTGSGISDDDLPFVFERFYKADKSRKKTSKRKGTGLGLSIAKNIVEAHDGTITVQSKHGEGTTFSFVIPKTEEE
ncbi:ATP-binding protein [Paraliobacillus ryukyuensis]|uniref:ATP-binding protein n=1 Tax=Paraliobacillus ryukyuensis TaxID=200904 RepID=UPI0009A569F4|nr:ATP-binding protein [Paraliobacillus ryukyuensis]